MAFKHHSVPARKSGARTLVLFHGTGGDERSLLELGRALDPDAALFGIRGRSDEEGMNRFFRRYSEGLFDEDDIRVKAAELADFIKSAGPTGERIAVGYSNGANMAAAMLLLHPTALDGAVLFRGMQPLNNATLPDLKGKRVFLANGNGDPMAPLDSAQRLADQLREAGADVSHSVLAAGHSLTRADVEAAAAWLAQG